MASKDKDRKAFNSTLRPRAKGKTGGGLKSRKGFKLPKRMVIVPARACGKRDSKNVVEVQRMVERVWNTMPRRKDLGECDDIIERSKLKAKDRWPGIDFGNMVQDEAGTVKEAKRSRLKAKRKDRGEIRLAKKLYKDRGGVSDLSGLPLLPPDHPLFHCQVSHILPKGSYGRIRTYPLNIMLVLYHEHRQWEENRNPDDLIALDPRWRKWIELRDEMRLKYHTNPNFPNDEQQ